MSGIGRIATGFRALGTLLAGGASRVRSFMQRAVIRNTMDTPASNSTSSQQRRDTNASASSVIFTGLTNYQSLDSIVNDDPFDDRPQAIIIPPVDYDSVSQTSHDTDMNIAPTIPMQVNEFIESIVDQSSMLEALLVLDGLDSLTRAESEFAARRDASISFSHAHDLQMRANREENQGNLARAIDLREEAQAVTERATHLETFANSLDDVYLGAVDFQSSDDAASEATSFATDDENILSARQATLAKVLIDRITDNASMQNLASELLLADPDLLALVVDEASSRAEALRVSGNTLLANTLLVLIDTLERGMLAKLFERVVDSESITRLVEEMKNQSPELVGKASQEALKKAKFESDNGNANLANLFVNLANQLDNIANLSSIDFQTSFLITQEIAAEARGLVYSISNTDSQRQIQAYLLDADLNLRLAVIDEANIEAQLLTHEGETDLANTLLDFAEQQVVVASSEILAFVIDEDSAANSAHAFANAHISLLNALYDAAWDNSLNATDEGDIELAQALVSFANQIDVLRQSSQAQAQVSDTVNDNADIEDFVLQAETLVDELTDENSLDRLTLQLANAPQELLEAVIEDATEQAKVSRALGEQVLSELYGKLVTRLRNG